MSLGYCGGCNQRTHVERTGNVLSCSGCGVIYHDPDSEPSEREKFEKDLAHWRWMKSQGAKTYGIFERDIDVVIIDAERDLKRLTHKGLLKR